MGRLHRVLSAAVAIGLGPAAVCPVSASGQSLARSSSPGAITRPVGEISGTVSDERGGLLSGVTVAVYGTTAAIDVTDAQGRFSLERLPVGDYVLHARLPGFASSRRESVRLTSMAPATYRLQLRRLDHAIPQPDGDAPAERTIMAAGLTLPPASAPDPGPAVTPNATPNKDDHSHTETAWWLRHLPRSILKDTANVVALSDDDDGGGSPAPASFDRRAPGSSYSTSLFGDLPFSGEVNLLTTGAIGGGSERFFSGDLLPRGVAYVSLGSPTPAGAWSMRAAMGQGDLSSWIVAGSFAANRPSTHAYDVGFSYSTQEHQVGTAMALAAVTDGSRNVGEVYAFDRWTLAPGMVVDYGGRYARYDYLPDRGLLSPRIGITLEPLKGNRVSASVSQRMLAPGAEEFLSPRVPGPWLPPERTFSPLGRHPFSVEEARTVDFSFEHAFRQSYAIGVRRFFQEIDNQLVTLFGLSVPGGPESVGHYYVANGGDADVQGWGLRFTTPAAQRVKASVDYSLIHTQWGPARRGTFPTWKSASAFNDLDGLHDITTSVQADIAETSTRVFVLYKLNTAFAHATADGFRPGVDGRFDMQVNQALPFGLAGTKWEVLVGLRNLFRDPSDPASVFDEILVVRPPKRVVGGFLVRF